MGYFAIRFLPRPNILTSPFFYILTSPYNVLWLFHLKRYGRGGLFSDPPSLVLYFLLDPPLSLRNYALDPPPYVFFMAFFFIFTQTY